MYRFSYFITRDIVAAVTSSVTSHVSEIHCAYINMSLQCVPSDIVTAITVAVQFCQGGVRECDLWDGVHHSSRDTLQVVVVLVLGRRFSV